MKITGGERSGGISLKHWIRHTGFIQDFIDKTDVADTYFLSQLVVG